MFNNKIIIILIFLSFLTSLNFALAQDETVDLQIPAPYDKAININPQNITPNDLKNLFPLSVSLDYNPKPILSSDTVKVDAQVQSSSGLDGISYSWFLDGKRVKGDTSILEFNMNENLINKDLRCGDFREVKVEITNNITKEKTASIIKIPIGLDLSFAKKSIGQADLGNPNTIDFNLSNSNIPVTSIILAEPDIFLAQSSQNQFRSGDIVEVTAVDLKNTYNNKACTTSANYTNYDSFLNSLSFEWALDGDIQKSQNGQGAQFNKAYFIIDTLPAQTMQNDAVNCGFQNYIGNSQVTLTIKGSSGNVIAQKEEPLNVIAPQVNLKPICGAYGKNIQCLNLNSTNLLSYTDATPTYQLTPGQQMNLQASLSNFSPSQQLDISWKVNGQVIDTKSISEPNTTFYTSPNITMANEVQNIEVEVTNHIFNSNETELASQKTVVTPNPVRGENLASGAIGSLQKFLPNSFKNLYNFVAVASVVGIIILLISLTEKKKNG